MENIMIKWAFIIFITIVFLIAVFSLAHIASKCSREEEAKWERERTKQSKAKSDISE